MCEIKIIIYNLHVGCVEEPNLPSVCLDPVWMAIRPMVGKPCIQWHWMQPSGQAKGIGQINNHSTPSSRTRSEPNYN